MRQRCAEQILRQNQTGAQHATGTGAFCDGETFLQVEGGLASGQGGDIGDQSQALPQVFRAVDANQDELVLNGQNRNFVSIEKLELAGGKKLFDRQSSREITHGALGVQLDE